MLPSALARVSGLTVGSCSYGRLFAFGPFAPAPRGADLAYNFSSYHHRLSGTFHPARVLVFRNLISLSQVLAGREFGFGNKGVEALQEVVEGAA